MATDWPRLGRTPPRRAAPGIPCGGRCVVTRCLRRAVLARALSGLVLSSEFRVFSSDTTANQLRPCPPRRYHGRFGFEEFSHKRSAFHLNPPQALTLSLSLSLSLSLTLTLTLTLALTPTLTLTI